MSPVFALLVGLILGFAAGVRVARRPVARDVMVPVPALRAKGGLQKPPVDPGEVPRAGVALRIAAPVPTPGRPL